MIKKQIRKIVCLLLFLASVFSAASFAADLDSVTADQLKKIISSQPRKIYLLDIRESRQFKYDAITDSHNIELVNLPDKYKSLPKNKDIYVISGDGQLSRVAIYALKYLGCKNPIFNLEGGVAAWKKSFPTIMVVDGVEIENLTPLGLKKIIDSKIKFQLVDSRSKSSFKRGHIPRAKHLDYASVFSSSKKIGLDKNKLVVVYCSGISCRSAVKVAERLVKLGFKKVKVLIGGFPAWETAGYVVEK